MRRSIPLIFFASFAASCGGGSGSSSPMMMSSAAPATSTSTATTTAPPAVATSSTTSAPDRSADWDEPKRPLSSASAQPWRSRAEFPAAITEAALEDYKGQVYAFGGDCGSKLSNEIWRYDPASNAWTRAGALATARAGARAARIGSTIYIVGGHDGSRALASVETFDAATGAVASVASLSTARNQTALAVQDGKLFVFGGTSEPTLSIANVLASAEVYDPATNKWSAIRSLPEPRWGVMATSAGNKIWLAGGHDGTRTGAAAHTDFFEYSPSTNAYVARARLRAPRHAGAALPYAGKIFVIGGTYTIPGFVPDADGTPPADAQFDTSLVEVYDVATDRWSTRATMLTPRTMVAGTTSDGWCWLLGGHSLDLTGGVGAAPGLGCGSAADGPVPAGARFPKSAFERFDPLTLTGTSPPLGSGGSGGSTTPGYHDLTLTSSGRTRSYSLYVPRNLPSGPRPLVLMFHGTGDAMHQLDAARFEEQADRDGALLLKPQGVPIVGPSHIPIYAYGYPQTIFSLWPLGLSPVPGETHVPGYPQNHSGPGADPCWEMHDWQRGVNLDWDLALDLIAETSSKYDVDRRRIYQMGQSNGALFTSTVGVHHGEVYAACASFSGGDIVAAYANTNSTVMGLSGWPSGFGPQGPTPGVVASSGGRRTPFIFFHGTKDPEVPSDGSTMLRAAMLANGWDENDAQTHIFPNGAHVWFTLNEEAWSFFLSRSLP